VTQSEASAIDQVRTYYETNTARFERFGQGRGTGAIHRAVRPDADDTDQNPFHTLEHMLLRRIARLPASAEPRHVLDLGCGVGASMIFLAHRAPIRATGVTLSPLQAARARERIAQNGLGERVRCLEGSYLELPQSVPVAALAFSIEAFIHGPNPGAFFEAAARHVCAGGSLVLFDDFLTERAATNASASEARLLQEVRDGWLANSLVTVREAEQLARRAGFELEEDVNLTTRLELARPRDRAIALLVAVGRHLPFQGFRFRSLLGGNALQVGLRSGLLEFRCLSFRRAST
jgi:cyclopropane fatty-acyl-phospholipid synthase-like methyltransferase